MKVLSSERGSSYNYSTIGLSILIYKRNAVNSCPWIVVPGVINGFLQLRSGRGYRADPVMVSLKQVPKVLNGI